MQMVIRDRYECTDAFFWSSLFFDDEYNRGVFLEGLKFKALEVLLQSADPAGNITRRMLVRPRLDVPSVLAGFFGDGFSYTEVGYFDAQTRRYEATLETSRLTSRINIRVVLWTEPRGDTCERVLEVDINVDMLGVGRLVESFLAHVLRTNYVVSVD